jgi:hypothetical protein
VGCESGKLSLFGTHPSVGGDLLRSILKTGPLSIEIPRGVAEFYRVPWSLLLTPTLFNSSRPSFDKANILSNAKDGKGSSNFREDMPLKTFRTVSDGNKYG